MDVWTVFGSEEHSVARCVHGNAYSTINIQVWCCSRKPETEATVVWKRFPQKKWKCTHKQHRDELPAPDTCPYWRFSITTCPCMHINEILRRFV